MGRESALKHMKMVELTRMSDGEIFVYESATFAGKNLGTQGANISRVCNGHRKQVKGYTARWI